MTASTRTRAAGAESAAVHSSPAIAHVPVQGTDRRAGWGLREVMDIRQASDYLGISPDSLYKYASENFIPAFKLGNRWRFKRSLLERWMEQQSLTGSAAQPRVVKPRQKKPATRAR